MVIFRLVFNFAHLAVTIGATHFYGWKIGTAVCIGLVLFAAAALIGFEGDTK